MADDCVRMQLVTFQLGREQDRLDAVATKGIVRVEDGRPIPQP